MKPIPSTPGPKANRETLVEHYKKLQVRFACLSYDRMVLLCPWCGTDEFEKAYKPPSERKKHGAEARFCSEKCAAAWDRLFARWWEPWAPDADLLMKLGGKRGD